MGAQRQDRLITVEEYLEFERKSESRHEYYDGVIFDMAGSSPNHNLIAIDTVSFLARPLHARGCVAFALDLRVKLSFTKYAYPDVVAVCGEQELTDDEPPSLLNPLLVIEVLSTSTEARDRTGKFDDFATRPSLKEYVLVSQDRPRVERYYRREDGLWEFEVYVGLEEVVHLRSIEMNIPMAEIYARVKFEEEPAE